MSAFGVFCLARIASLNKHIDSYNLGQPAFLPFFFSDGNMARFALYANSSVLIDLEGRMGD